VTGNDSRDREPVHFLVFSASLRADSLNTRLARLAATTIEANGGKVDFRPMTDFDTPSFNADVQDQAGFPPGADLFRECVQTNGRLMSTISSLLAKPAPKDDAWREHLRAAVSAGRTGARVRPLRQRAFRGPRVTRSLIDTPRERYPKVFR
jgi:hypothetical protein